MDFNFSEKIIYCENTIDGLSAQFLYNACLDVEDEPLAVAEDGIADGEGKLSIGDERNALNVILLGWKIRSLKTEGKFLVSRGTVLTKDLETNETSPFIFDPNPLIEQVNQLAVNSVGNTLSDIEAAVASVLNQVRCV